VRTTRDAHELRKLPAVIDQLQELGERGERQALAEACLAAAHALQ
jgi:hypothetical protein